MSVDDKETVKINIRLTREEKNICDTEARTKGMSRNAYLRGLINEIPRRKSTDEKLTIISARLGELEAQKKPPPEK